nr:universal stress protein [Halorubrum sp. 48-1-W]
MGIGSHGRSGTDRTLLRSVAETVSRRARTPVTSIGRSARIRPSRTR